MVGNYSINHVVHQGFPLFTLKHKGGKKWIDFPPNQKIWLKFRHEKAIQSIDYAVQTGQNTTANNQTKGSKEAGKNVKIGFKLRK